MKDIVILIIFIFSFTFAAAGQDNIDIIRKACNGIDSQIEEMSRHPELSSVFATELVVNKHLAPYPAVGTYQRTTTFFYTYGNRERNPYPDRLLKIVAVYKRSSRVENIEFYFDAAGRLVFAFASNPDGAIKETRMYFASGRLIKMTDDNNNVGLKTQHAVEAETLSKKEAARLTGIFRTALVEND